MESLSAERQEMVHTLMAVAGIDDVEFAREFLQDNGWQLEPSVNAYMMMIGDDGGGGGSAMEGRVSPPAAPAAPPDIPVALPEPTPAPPVVQRLVEDMPSAEGPVYESFRNFAAEGMQVAQSAAAHYKGNVLTINDKAENDFILSYIDKNYPGKKLGIGLSDILSEGIISLYSSTYTICRTTKGLSTKRFVPLQLKISVILLRIFFHLN